jgi:hypothetical protein
MTQELDSERSQIVMITRGVAMIEVSICPQSLIPFVPLGKKITLADLLQIKKTAKFGAIKKVPKEKTIKEKISRKEYDRQRYLLNRDRVLAAQIEYRRTHKEQIDAYQRWHYQEKKSELVQSIAGSVSER